MSLSEIVSLDCCLGVFNGAVTRMFMRGVEDGAMTSLLDLSHRKLDFPSNHQSRRAGNQDATPTSAPPKFHRAVISVADYTHLFSYQRTRSPYESATHTRPANWTSSVGGIGATLRGTTSEKVREEEDGVAAEADCRGAEAAACGNGAGSLLCHRGHYRHV